MQPIRRSGSGRALALTVVASAVLLGACAGDNLFNTLTSGTQGPEVDISAPAPNFTIAAGAPLQIIADASATDGLVSATYSGVFTGSGSAAFVSETESLGIATTAALDNTLDAAAGAGTGEVWVIVQVADARGGIKADTVTITVN